MIKQYKDKFGNKAIIMPVSILPYNGSKTRVKAYKLTLLSEYDNNLIYHVSIHEALQAAISRMNDFSCREWSEYKEVYND